MVYEEKSTRDKEILDFNDTFNNKLNKYNEEIIQTIANNKQ